MSVLPARRGRPSRPEVYTGTRRFLQLVAAGERFDIAARRAGVSDRRAVEILSELGLRGIVALASHTSRHVAQLLELGEEA